VRPPRGVRVRCARRAAHAVMLLAQIESYVKQLLEWNETRSNLVAASQATRDQARTQTQH